jgi:dihydroorotate dehydrogenase (fumarate)
MERTAIRLGGIELNSSVMNASGPGSAERGEIFVIAALHNGAVVFKSCNAAGSEKPEILSNRGVEHFAAIARDLSGRGKTVIASVMGATEDEMVRVAAALDDAGARIIELNLAEDYVIDLVAPFASVERLKSLIRKVRNEVKAPLAVKVPDRAGIIAPHAVVGVFADLGVAIVACANDLPKDLEIDLATGIVAGKRRALSQVHAFHLASGGVFDVVAVGGIGTGRDAYIAHLTGAKAVQVGSVWIEEGAGTFGRIDRELDALLGQHGKRSVEEVIGRVRFAG